MKLFASLLPHLGHNSFAAAQGLFANNTTPTTSSPSKSPTISPSSDVRKPSSFCIIFLIIHQFSHIYSSHIYLSIKKPSYVPTTPYPSYLPTAPTGSPSYVPTTDIIRRIHQAHLRRKAQQSRLRLPRATSLPRITRRILPAHLRRQSLPPYPQATCRPLAFQLMCLQSRHRQPRFKLFGLNWLRTLRHLSQHLSQHPFQQVSRIEGWTKRSNHWSQTRPGNWTIL